MKTIKTLITIVTLLFSTISFAQTHNTTTGSTCKYAKNRCTNMEGCPQCAACDADDKKEKDAKIAEVKKRNDKIWADAKIKKDAEDKAYQDKIAADNAEAKRKAESGNVVINAQPTSVPNNNQTQKSKVENTGYKIDYFYTNTRYYNFQDIYRSKETNEGFLVNGDTILNSNDYSGFYANHIYDENNFPPNIGIVRLNQKKIIPLGDEGKVTQETNGYDLISPVFDLVNSKGERLLNDNSITLIMHFFDNYFLIGRGSINAEGYRTAYFSDGVEIYNIQSKKAYRLEKRIYDNKTEIDNRLNYNKDEIKQWPKGTYKAYINVKIDYKYYRVYYITNDGQVESQDLDYRK